MTSIFEGTQPLKSRPKFQAKQGAPFEVLGTYNYISLSFVLAYPSRPKTIFFEIGVFTKDYFFLVGKFNHQKSVEWNVGMSAKGLVAVAQVNL